MWLSINGSDDFKDFKEVSLAQCIVFKLFSSYSSLLLILSTGLVKSAGVNHAVA